MRTQKIVHACVKEMEYDGKRYLDAVTMVVQLGHRDMGVELDAYLSHYIMTLAVGGTWDSADARSGRTPPETFVTSKRARAAIGQLRNAYQTLVNEMIDIVEQWHPDARPTAATPRLVVFHKEGCVFCEELLAENGVLDRLRDRVPGMFVNAIEQSEDPDLIAAMDIRSYPDIRVVKGSASGPIEIAAFGDQERDVEDLERFVREHMNLPQGLPLYLMNLLRHDREKLDTLAGDVMEVARILHENISIVDPAYTKEVSDVSVESSRMRRNTFPARAGRGGGHDTLFGNEPLTDIEAVAPDALSASKVQEQWPVAFAQHWEFLSDDRVPSDVRLLVKLYAAQELATGAHNMNDDIVRGLGHAMHKADQAAAAEYATLSEEMSELIGLDHSDAVDADILDGYLQANDLIQEDILEQEECLVSVAQEVIRQEDEEQKNVFSLIDKEYGVERALIQYEHLKTTGLQLETRLEQGGARALIALAFSNFVHRMCDTARQTELLRKLAETPADEAERKNFRSAFMRRKLKTKQQIAERKWRSWGFPWGRRRVVPAETGEDVALVDDDRRDGNAQKLVGYFQGVDDSREDVDRDGVPMGDILVENDFSTVPAAVAPHYALRQELMDVEGAAVNVREMYQSRDTPIGFLTASNVDRFAQIQPAGAIRNMNTHARRFGPHEFQQAGGAEKSFGEKAFEEAGGAIVGQIMTTAVESVLESRAAAAMRTHHALGAAYSQFIDPNTDLPTLGLFFANDRIQRGQDYGQAGSKTKEGVLYTAWMKERTAGGPMATFKTMFGIRAWSKTLRANAKEEARYALLGVFWDLFVRFVSATRLEMSKYAEAYNRQLITDKTRRDFNQQAYMQIKSEMMARLQQHADKAANRSHNTLLDLRHKKVLAAIAGSAAAAVVVGSMLTGVGEAFAAIAGLIGALTTIALSVFRRTSAWMTARGTHKDAKQSEDVIKQFVSDTDIKQEDDPSLVDVRINKIVTRMSSVVPAVIGVEYGNPEDINFVSNPIQRLEGKGPTSGGATDVSGHAMICAAACLAITFVTSLSAGW